MIDRNHFRLLHQQCLILDIEIKLVLTFLSTDCQNRKYIIDMKFLSI